MLLVRSRRLLGRLAGAAAASGLVLTGLVATAGPATAAACSGTTGVTVVVDTGSSISTRCASGNPDSAWAALEAAGHSVTAVQQFPGAICRINGYPSDQGCVRMPPSDAYWAFFHAARGGSWTYSSSGARSYDPPSGSVVGFRFGSGQQPRVAPPAKATTSTPKTTTSAPKPTTAAPKPTTAAPKPTAAAPKPTAGSGSGSGSGSGTGTGSGTTKAPAASASPTGSASVAPSGSPSASPSTTGSPSGSTAGSTSTDATTTAAAPSSSDGSGPGLGTLLAGGGLVALVAGGAGWAAWRRRA